VLNQNGTVDASFNTGGTGFSVAAAGIQKIITLNNSPYNDKYMVGGDQTQYNGVSIPKGITRINNDGSINAEFNSGKTGVGASGAVSDIKEIPTAYGGGYLFGGTFSQYNGASLSGILKIDDLGNNDSSFQSVGTISTGGRNNSFIVTSTGKIVSLGVTTFGGDAYKYLIRLNIDGTVDSSFSMSGGTKGFDVFPNVVIELTVGGNSGKYMVAGGGFTGFTDSSGVTRTANDIVRINSDGTQDTTFDSGTGIDTSSIEDMMELSDGKIVIVGLFNSYNGTSGKNIFVLNTDGSIYW
jgi:hypothetical protein